MSRDVETKVESRVTKHRCHVSILDIVRSRLGTVHTMGVDCRVSERLLHGKLHLLVNQRVIRN